MEDIEIIIKPLTQEYLEASTKILIKNFEDKFEVVFKDIPSNTLYSIMKDLISLMKNNLGTIEGFYIAVIKINQDIKVVGVLSLMYRELQIKEKNYRDIQWKTVRKYLSFWKSLRTGVLLDFLSTRKLKSDELYIDSISTSEEYRGKGVGSTMISFTENLAHSKNFNEISLFVSCKNSAAIDFYEKRDFQKVSKKKSRISKRLLKIPIFYKMIKKI
jgi:ribosomal protein S18 acetylase RimI-like enzyme